MLVKEFMAREIAALDAKHKANPEQIICNCCGICAASSVPFEERQHCWTCHEHDFPFKGQMDDFIDSHFVESADTVVEIVESGYDYVFKCNSCKDKFTFNVSNQGEYVGVVYLV